MDIRSWTTTPETSEKLEAIKQHRMETYPQESSRYYSFSHIIRDAVDLQYRHEIDGETIIHEDDPRYN